MGAGQTYIHHLYSFPEAGRCTQYWHQQLDKLNFYAGRNTITLAGNIYRTICLWTRD